MAANTESSSSNMVSTSTATSGATRPISRVAANPSSSGICRSSTATSGRCSTTSFTALAPVGGHADDLDVGQRPEQRGQPGPDDRVVVGQHHATAPRHRADQREPGPDPAAGGRRTGGERAAQLGRALPHRLQPDARATTGRTPARRR